MKKLKMIAILSLLAFSSPALRAEDNFLVAFFKNLFGRTFDFNGTLRRWHNPPGAYENVKTTQDENAARPEDPVKVDQVGTCIPESASNLDPVPEIIEETKTELTLREKTFQNFEKLGGDPIALSQALCFLESNKNSNFKAQGDPARPQGIKIENQRYITINDHNYPMGKARFFVIDLETGKSEAYFSAHGGSGRNGVPESSIREAVMSNKDGSYASPRGFFITGSKRIGSSDPRWKFSMKLHGLQKGVNDNSYARAVVMHPFPMVPPGKADSDETSPKLTDIGPYAFSRGCPMLAEEHAAGIIDRIKAPDQKTGGSLYYNYSPEEKSRGAEYCGDEGLMKK